MLCLPRLTSLCMRTPPARLGSSIFTTSAPNSASVRPQVGPARMMQRSSTLRPSRAERSSRVSGGGAGSGAASSQGPSTSSRSAPGMEAPRRTAPGEA